MKRKTTIFALCTLFGLGIALASPQDGKTPSGTQSQPDTAQHSGSAHHQADPKHQVEKLSKRLNLTADQQNQLLPILSERQQKIQALRNDNTLAQQDRREKLRSVMEDSNAKIKGLLNDTQKQTFEQMEQQRRSHMRQRSHQDQSSGTGN